MSLSFLGVGHITQSPTVILDQVVTEGNIYVFILFSDGVENGRYVALCILNKVR